MISNSEQKYFLCKEKYKGRTQPKVVFLLLPTEMEVKRYLFIYALCILMYSVLTDCVIIFEMPLTPSLSFKSSIYTCRIGKCQGKWAYPPKKFRSNWSVEKLHEMNFQVIGIVIRCELKLHKFYGRKSSHLRDLRNEEMCSRLPVCPPPGPVVPHDAPHLCVQEAVRQGHRETWK